MTSFCLNGAPSYRIQTQLNFLFQNLPGFCKTIRGRIERLGIGNISLFESGWRKLQSAGQTTYRYSWQDGQGHAYAHAHVS